MIKYPSSFFNFSSSLIKIIFFSIFLSSCAPTSATEIFSPPTSTPVVIPEGWQEYSSEFTSDTGNLHYTLYHPSHWYVYPSSTTTVNLGSEDVTTIQSFARAGISGFQEPGTIKFHIYALPCESTQEGCNTDNLTLIAPGLPGEKKVKEGSYITPEGESFTTYWTVRIIFKDYSFGLTGFMAGTPDENVDQIEILDQILSTLVLY